MLHDNDPVDEILRQYGIPGPWKTLAATGLANRIYATKDIILRIASDHPEGISDARTESVAAPIAKTAGVLTPRLIAFDDSRKLSDRPFSLWEKVNGLTLGNIADNTRRMPKTWREIGHQLALLHTNVNECPDPYHYLDHPEREFGLDTKITRYLSSSRIGKDIGKELVAIIKQIRPYIDTETISCFIHNDIHDMNIMCDNNDTLMAIIDWGDAGWGDPVLEFTQVPFAAIPLIVDGYREVAPTLLGQSPEVRIVWDKLCVTLEKIAEDSTYQIPLDQLKSFVKKKL
jgi:aminoglycoside phosphotransferase (APT) family kinase protein